MQSENIKEKVFEVLVSPMTNVDVYKKLNKTIPKKDVDRAIRDLRSEGKVVSLGWTAARKHMRLSTAIEELFYEMKRLKKRKLRIET